MNDFVDVRHGCGPGGQPVTHISPFSSQKLLHGAVRGGAGAGLARLGAVAEGAVRAARAVGRDEIGRAGRCWHRCTSRRGRTVRPRRGIPPCSWRRPGRLSSRRCTSRPRRTPRPPRGSASRRSSARRAGRRSSRRRTAPRRRRGRTAYDTPTRAGSTPSAGQVIDHAVAGFHRVAEIDGASTLAAVRQQRIGRAGRRRRRCSLPPRRRRPAAPRQVNPVGWKPSTGQAGETPSQLSATSHSTGHRSADEAERLHHVGRTGRRDAVAGLGQIAATRYRAAGRAAVAGRMRARRRRRRSDRACTPARRPGRAH